MPQFELCIFPPLTLPQFVIIFCHLLQVKVSGTKEAWRMFLMEMGRGGSKFGVL